MQKKTLNTYLAHAGICSRRKAVELIQSEQILVNGAIETRPFYEVQDTDIITYQGKVIEQEKLIYIVYNKPKDVICTLKDTHNRQHIATIFAPHFKERLYPVGRLDRATTGVLLITNDGNLTQRLAHPKFNISKTYHVTTDTPIDHEHLTQLEKGVTLSDGFMQADVTYFPTTSRYTAAITIHSGKNRIVRRLFQHFGYTIKKLDRTSYASLTYKNLKQGQWRQLSPSEVASLQ